MARPEMASGEGPVRMDVHRQPLTGVEQLHQQGRVGTEVLDMVWPEPRLCVCLDNVAEKLPIGHRSQAVIAATEPWGRRRNPVLGAELVAARHIPQLRDRLATFVKLTGLVGSKLDRLHRRSR